MTLDEEIVAALEAAGINIWPGAAPDDELLPLVIYGAPNRSPQNTLLGYADWTNSHFVFQCWAATKSGASTLVQQVSAAIEATSSLIAYREDVSGEDYESQTDEYVEPVQYGFWHS